jgi:hypothetical protein
MTPRTKRRTSLFPAYTPPDHDNLTMEEWAQHMGAFIQATAKRALTFGGILVAIGGGGAYASHVNETKPVDDATVRVKAIEDSVSAHGRRLGENERLMRAVLYISCETLAKVQPAQSIPPRDCLPQASQP